MVGRRWTRTTSKPQPNSRDCRQKREIRAFQTRDFRQMSAEACLSGEELWWWAAVDSNHLPPRTLARALCVKSGETERRTGCYVA